jgi:hypothetical protein
MMNLDHQMPKLLLLDRMKLSIWKMNYPFSIEE